MPTYRPAALAAALLLTAAAPLASTAAIAAPALDLMFGDHAVVQRDAPIRISGTAAAREPVTVTFAGESSSVRSDAKGRWSAEFAPRGAGGPYRIEVRGAAGTAVAAQDVMVGDVWLCSGQSNMEYPLPRALGYGEPQAEADSDLRLTKVPQQLSDKPQESFAKPWQWHVADPSVKEFSAACYFMVSQLRQSEKVPIGAIDDTWGGTPIRQWMDEAAVRASGGGALLDAAQLYRSNPELAMRRFGETWENWWRSRTGDQPGREPWNGSDRLSWKSVPHIGNWDEWGDDWPKFDGSVWFRRRMTLTAAEAAQPATLSLGVLDDLDETFVNGVAVGGTNDWSSERNYAVPKGLLHAGANEVLVFVRDNGGPGGMLGPADEVKLSFGDGHAQALASGWQYSRIDDAVGSPPTAPWQGVAGVSHIYNAMVAPLGPLGLRGVAWYQGEADVGTPGYDRRLAAWMASWRAQFRNPKLPFLIVGLAGFGKPVSAPSESGWAQVIDEQRLAVTRDPNAALVSAIDLGEPADIHPSNKQEVGNRLALAARALVYRDGGTVGPLPLGASRAGNAVVVTFSKPLQTLSGGSAIAFELCGAAKGTCRYADARVRGSTVELPFDGQPVTRVRYAWADYPYVNLYDLDSLPAPPFEIPIQP